MNLFRQETVEIDGETHHVVAIHDGNQGCDGCLGAEQLHCSNMPTCSSDNVGIIWVKATPENIAKAAMQRLEYT